MDSRGAATSSSSWLPTWRSISASRAPPSSPLQWHTFASTVSLEARRTWLASFVAVSTSSMSTRRPIAISWNAHHQDCLLHLESCEEPPDILFCQIDRITNLIQEISEQLGLCQLGIFVDGSIYSTHVTIEALTYKVDAWAALIPPNLAASQTLRIWRHMAMIYIYELVLHTSTNKACFAAPFIPGRISVEDFPTPSNIIPPLRRALAVLVLHCHAVIDTAAEMDPDLILSLPTFCFAPTVLYSLFVLVNLWVATTNPRNTYGHYLSKDIFRIEEYSLVLRRLSESVRSRDPTFSCYTTRLFDATGWLAEWYRDYNTILRRYETNVRAQ